MTRTVLVSVIKKKKKKKTRNDDDERVCVRRRRRGIHGRRRKRRNFITRSGRNRRKQKTQPPLPGESFDLMSTDEDGEVFINAGDYLSRQRALESGDFDALADMDKAFEKLSEVDDMGPDM